MTPTLTRPGRLLGFDPAPVGRALVSYGLPGTSASADLETIDPSSISTDGWRTLLHFVDSHRIESSLAWAIEAGGWEVAPSRRADARKRHHRAMALTLVLERELLDLVADLDRAGVDYRVLKGTAAARLDEVDPSQRSFGDLDLLVTGRDVERAGVVLAARGGQRRFPEPRRGFDRRFSKGVSFAFARNVEVDLHRTLTGGPFGLTIDLDELFSHTESFSIGAVSLVALDRPSRFIHACLHGVLTRGPRPLRTLRDLVLSAPRTPSEFEVVRDRADRWRVTPVVSEAVRATVDELRWAPPTELGAWSCEQRLTARDRRWLVASAGPRRSSARQAITAVEAIPGHRDQLAYLLAVLTPTSSPGFGATARRWQRGWRSLRSGPSGRNGEGR